MFQTARLFLGTVPWLLRVALATGLALALLSLRRVSVGDGWHHEAGLLGIALVLGLFAQALLLRRLSLGARVPIAMLIIAAALPYLVGAWTAGEQFEISLEASRDDPISNLRDRLAWASWRAAEAVSLGAALSGALFFSTAVLVSLYPTARRASWTWGNLGRATLLAVPSVVFVGIGVVDNQISAATLGVLVVLCLTTVLSAAGPPHARLGRVIAVAACAGMGCAMALALRSAELFDCGFGYHGCGPASRLDIVKTCIQEVRPDFGPLSSPWAAAAGMLGAVALLVGRREERTAALRWVVAIAVPAAALFGLAAEGAMGVVPRLAEYLPEQSAGPAPLVLPSEGDWRAGFVDGPKVTVRVGALHEEIRNVRVEEPFGAGSRQLERTLSGAMGIPSLQHDCHHYSDGLPPYAPGLTIAADASIGGANLRALLRAAHRAGASEIRWMSADPESRTALTGDARSWALRLAAAHYQAPSGLTTSVLNGHFWAIVGRQISQLELHLTASDKFKPIRFTGRLGPPAQAMRSTIGLAAKSVPVVVLRLADDATVDSLVGSIAQLHSWGYEVTILVQSPL